MGTSSINIAKASRHFIFHNSRENYSHSVVFLDEKNELWNSAQEAFGIYKKELSIRSQKYTERTNQKLQKSTNTHMSAIVNLERHHTFKDLQAIVAKLEKDLGTKVFQVAIHRDEGKLIPKKDSRKKKILTSGHDFFLNPQDGKLYEDKKYTKPLDTSEYVVSKNYHAHIEFLGIDQDGNSIKRKLNRHYLQNLQTEVAQTLQMQRGKPGSKRLNTKAYKELKAFENAKNAEIEIQKNSNMVVEKMLVDELAKQKDLKAEVAALRKDLQEAKADRKDYAELEALNKELLEKVKSKDLTIGQMQQELSDLKEKLLEKPQIVEVEKEVEKIVEVENSINEDLQKEVVALKEKLLEKPQVVEVEKIKEVEVIKEVEKIVNVEVEKKVYVADTTEIDNLKQELGDLKNLRYRERKERADEIAELKEKLKIAIKRSEMLEKRVLELEQENTRLKEDLANLTSQNNENDDLDNLTEMMKSFNENFEQNEDPHQK